MRTPDTELRIPIDDISGDISRFTKAVMDIPSQGRRISRLSFEANPNEPRRGIAVIETTADKPTAKVSDTIF